MTTVDTEFSEYRVVKQNGASILIQGRHERIIPKVRNITSLTFPTASFSGLYAGSESTINLEIKRHTLHRIKNMFVYIRFTIATAAARLAPAPFWISKWELKSRSGTGDIIIRGFRETEWILNYFFPEEVQKEYGRQGFYKPENVWADGEKLIPVSGVVRAAIPLHAEALGWGALDIMELSEDLQLSLTFPANPTSSSSGTPAYTVNDLRLIIENMEYSDKSLEAQEKASLNGLLRRSISLYPDERAVTATVTASTQYEFTLDFLNDRKVAFLLVSLRSSTALTSQGAINATILGAGGSFDIVDPSGVSLTGGPVSVESITKMMSDEGFGHLAKTGWYIIPFCENLHKAYRGEMDTGYWHSKSSENRLRITPGAAPTNCVWTFTLTNPANDGGNAALQFGRSITPTQAFNVSAADAKTDLDASYQYLDIYGAPTTAFSATPLAATSTLTFSAGGAPGMVDHLPNCHITSNNLTDGLVAEVVVSESWSTLGVPGFVTGTYAVTVHAFCYRTLDHHSDGTISSYYS